MRAKLRHIILLLLSISMTAYSQEQSESSKPFDDSDSRLINCEQYSADVDRMRGVFSDLIEKSAYVILVARLGKGETKRDLNRRRLHNVGERLKAAGFEAKKIVVAEGERVSGLGRIEVYAGGRMIESLRVRRNQDICVECCGPDESYYPYKEIFERRNKPSVRRRA